MARDLHRSSSIRRASVSSEAAPSSDLAVNRVPTVPHRPSQPLAAAVVPTTQIRKSWQLVCLAEITNFATLRRQVGCPRSDALIFDLLSRIRYVLPAAATAIIGRVTVELAFEADAVADLFAITQQLAEACRAPFDLDGEMHRLDIAIGAASALLGTTEDVRMIEQAESALDEARGEHRVVLRDLSMGAPALDRLTLTRELPGAISRGEMFLQYQPKVHVRRQEIRSAEALVRWQHPARGLILPGDFITLAEDAGQIATLTLWTLDQVVADQALLADDGHDLTIFINISGQLLGDPRFVETACARVRESGVKIGFEITETAVIRDPQSAIAHLQIFADQGITIAIDDYGAGLSSLAYLKQLPACELKIDKMFVLQLTSSNRDPLIVRSTIDLAHALDMEVTAEGVETQAAMALLSVMGCDMVQGYLISRPLSIDAFHEFLREDPLGKLDGGKHLTFQRPATFWKSA